jgi:hypothetical protein
MKLNIAILLLLSGASATKLRSLDTEEDLTPVVADEILLEETLEGLGEEGSECLLGRKKKCAVCKPIKKVCNDYPKYESEYDCYARKYDNYGYDQDLDRDYGYKCNKYDDYKLKPQRKRRCEPYRRPSAYCCD